MTRRSYSKPATRAPLPKRSCGISIDGAEVRRAVLRHAQAHFSWDRAARLSTELYRELLMHKGS